jgi:hypothetical protein
MRLPPLQFKWGFEAGLKENVNHPPIGGLTYTKSTAGKSDNDIGYMKSALHDITHIAG